MSRTVRCKESTPPENWLISELEFYELKVQMWAKGYQKNWRHLVKDTFKATRKAELKKAHSDGGWRFFWTENPPSDFVRTLRRKRRLSDAAELHHAMAKDFGESLVPTYPRDVKDAAWIWD